MRSARRRARVRAQQPTTPAASKAASRTGDAIVVRAAMKPIATLRSPLRSVELGTHRAVESRFERSDVCAVPAAGVVLEAVVALALADAALDALRRRHGRGVPRPPWTPIAPAVLSR